jgi:hypothetical protein
MGCGSQQSAAPAAPHRRTCGSPRPCSTGDWLYPTYTVAEGHLVTSRVGRVALRAVADFEQVRPVTGERNDDGKFASCVAYLILIWQNNANRIF